MVNVHSQRKEDEERMMGKPKSNTWAKIIALTLVVLLALSIVFIVLYVQELDREEPKEPTIKVCISKECSSAAASLVKSMNPNADPCFDFFEFACGGWNRTEPIPDDKGSWSAFSILRRDLQRNLRFSLEQISANENENSAMSKLKRYYVECSNESKIEEDTATALTGYLAEYGINMGNWPFSTVVPTAAQIATAIGIARRHGNTLGIFNSRVVPQQYDTKHNWIEFEVPGFAMDRATYVSNEADKQRVREAYATFGRNVAFNYRKNVVNDSTAVADDSTIRAMFDDFVQFERELMLSTLPPNETRDETDRVNPIQLSQMNQYTSWGPFMSMNNFWTDYVRGAWPAATNIVGTTRVNVRQKGYYSKLNQVLQGRFTASPENALRFLANYVGWKIIEPLVEHLSVDFQAARNEFLKVYRDLKSSPPQWERCIDTINDQLPNAVGSLYVRNHFSQAAKDELVEMIDNLLDSFKEIVKESDWMDEATRLEALKKANHIRPVVAYEDYLYNNISRLDQEYEDFTVASSYLRTYDNGVKVKTSVEAKKLMKENNYTDWITGAAIVNAFYMPEYNSITFPAGILQAPFLGKGYPKYWNYAAIGTVIGHEITHGFDDQGSLYDFNGNLTNWWNEKARQEFKKRAQNIINQYSQYEYLGYKIIGANNQGENIADNGGIKESFRAWKSYIATKRSGEPEPRLPGFENFSNEQMFYLSYAQVWCGDYRPKEMEAQLYRPHSPGKFRVIGPLHNSASFALAYRCSDETKMNPSPKYEVW